MDTLQSIRCVLAVVRTGNFSAAARELDTVPSLVTKRIRRLEDRLNVRLFDRTTRKVELTHAGEQFYPKFLRLIAEADAALQPSERGSGQLTGAIRMKCSSSISFEFFGGVVARFIADHPSVRVDLTLIDRTVNPIEEAFDICIAASSQTFHGVTSKPLCPLTRKLVASPAYLERAGWPQHPRDLVAHECLTFNVLGSTWQMEGPGGAVSVDIHARFTTSDTRALVAAALSGAGIACIGTYAVREALDAGDLVDPLPDFRVQTMMLKALVPDRRMHDPAIRQMLKYLEEACSPAPPWDL